MADVVISLFFLEHVPDRVATLRRLCDFLVSGVRMIHLVLTAWRKLFKWTGVLPEMVRRQDGQRRDRKIKTYPDRQTNNPMRPVSRAWSRKLVLRVYSECHSNLDETL